MEKMTCLWLVTARPCMHHSSKWLWFQTVYHQLILDMLSHWQLMVASSCATRRTKKHRFSGIFGFDSRSSLGLKQWMSLAMWAVVLTHVVVQPTYWQSNSSLAHGDTLGDKCPTHHFGHRKAWSKQPLIQLHLDPAQWCRKRLTFCLMVQRAHMNACYATEWCLKAHSRSWVICVHLWNLTEFVKSAHQLTIAAVPSNEFVHSMC